MIPVGSFEVSPACPTRAGSTCQPSRRVLFGCYQSIVMSLADDKKKKKKKKKKLCQSLKKIKKHKKKKKITTQKKKKQ
eukprot:NODE_21287_length_760_cov_47.431280.p3 GENE.NODE_21287_length_760_cov_47.431280~~NODE_21287_length_760_cov_47.431280.p3  ORF type:complete len:78 (+),score=35.33 NODE_21287_length_760_cov_47.431280:473-706(+)